jgi:hypothetical protein
MLSWLIIWREIRAGVGLAEREIGSSGVGTLD